MTLQEFYDALARHDWYHGLSDDPGVYRRGKDSADKLLSTSRISTDHERLYADYCDYIFDNGAKPVRPE